MCCDCAVISRLAWPCKQFTMGWDKIAEVICLSQASSDQMAEEADALNSESDSDPPAAVPCTQPGQIGTHATWWAKLIVKHTNTLSIQIPDQPLPHSMLSLCSGALSEVAACKVSFPNLAAEFHALSFGMCLYVLHIHIYTRAYSC